MKLKFIYRSTMTNIMLKRKYKTIISCYMYNNEWNLQLSQLKLFMLTLIQFMLIGLQKINKIKNVYNFSIFVIICMI